MISNSVASCSTTTHQSRTVSVFPVGNGYLCLAGRFALITGRFVDLLSPKGSTGFVEDVSDAFLGDGTLFVFCGHRRAGLFTCKQSSKENTYIYL